MTADMTVTAANTATAKSAKNAKNASALSAKSVTTAKKSLRKGMNIGTTVPTDTTTGVPLR